MPELTLHRLRPIPSPPMVCMYCGEPATHAAEEWVPNPRDSKRDTGGGGGADIPAVGGDDPVSATIGLLLLPFAVWDMIVALARFRWPRRQTTNVPKPLPPLNPPHTLVVITACDRHRRFRRRFVWAGLAGLLALAALWVVTVRTNVESDVFTLLLTVALIATIGGPLALAFWYTLAGPVIVDRTTQDTVVLDRVRPAYFDATGIPP